MAALTLRTIASTAVSKTATGNSGNATITVSPNVFGIVVGHLVDGTGIAVGATVTVISPATNQITLSAVNTGAVSGTVNFKEFTKGSPLTNQQIDDNFIEARRDLTTKAPLESPGFTGTATFGAASFADAVTFNSTGAVKLPVGTELQRPTGATGLIRYNTTSLTFEGYSEGVWGAIGGGIEYARKTSGYTASSGEGVIADTSGGSFTVTLPATPTTGDYVVIVDGANFNSINLTVARNGSTIEGAVEDLVLDIQGAAVQLIYDGTTWQTYAQVGAAGGTAIDASTPQTLTNKTLSVDSNTLSGVTASSFVLSNASGNIDGAAAQKAIPTGTVVGTTDAQSLTNKTLGTGTIVAAAVTGTDNLMTRVMLQDTGWDFFDNSTSNAIDYVNGSVQRWSPNTGAQTLTISNWPPSGAMGELLIQGVNLGSSTITWPTINWIKSDGTTTTSFAANGVTLQAGGTDWVFLWTYDAGGAIYGKVVR